MGLFSHKEKIPELPMSPLLPSLPENPEELPQISKEEELPELPSFPKNFHDNDLNQEIVKSAVSDNSSGESEVIEPEQNVEELIPSIPSQEINPAEEETVNNKKSISNSEGKFSEPVFIRIDKYQAAKKNVEEIRIKVSEMEKIINKLNELKLKEDEEIKQWSEEVEKLRTRLRDIDSDIFNQI